jgi:hypothetical protein
MVLPAWEVENVIADIAALAEPMPDGYVDSFYREGGADEDERWFGALRPTTHALSSEEYDTGLQPRPATSVRASP